MTVAECSLTSCAWARSWIASHTMPGQGHSQPTLDFFWSRLCAWLGVNCYQHFWQNDRDLFHATAVTQGWNRRWRRVSTQNKLQKRTFSGHFCAYTHNVQMLMRQILTSTCKHRLPSRVDFQLQRFYTHACWRFYTHAGFPHVLCVSSMCKNDWMLR